jgi:hypothetical protein
VRQLDVYLKSRRPADSHSNRGGQRRAAIAERRTEGERRVSFENTSFLRRQACRASHHDCQAQQRPQRRAAYLIARFTASAGLAIMPPHVRSRKEM